MSGNSLNSHSQQRSHLQQQQQSNCNGNNNNNNNNRGSRTIDTEITDEERRLLIKEGGWFCLFIMINEMNE